MRREEISKGEYDVLAQHLEAVGTDFLPSRPLVTVGCQGGRLTGYRFYRYTCESVAERDELARGLGLAVPAATQSPPPAEAPFG